MITVVILKVTRLQIKNLGEHTLKCGKTYYELIRRLPSAHNPATWVIYTGIWLGYIDVREARCAIYNYHYVILFPKPKLN